MKDTAAHRRRQRLAGATAHLEGCARAVGVNPCASNLERLLNAAIEYAAAVSNLERGG